MRSILFVSVMNGAAWGGSEELWFRSALWLAHSDHKVGVCLFSWPGKKEKIKILADAGCKIYLLPGKKETRGIWCKLKLGNALKKIPFSDYQKTIVNQGGWKDIAYFPFKSLHKILTSYCLSFHNYDADKKLSGKRKQAIQEWVENAAINIAASGKIFETIKINFDLEIPRQKILINPITFYPPAQAEPYPPVESRIIFLMVAALDIQRKGQDVLIKTLSTGKWKQRDWELHLYGEGNDQEILANMIVAHKLQSKVFLKGFTNEVKEMIVSSHMLLQITNKDAMPISVMEAMSVGRPVIGSNVGDMPRWIIQDENGWIVNKVNQGSIDDVLEYAWNNKHKWEIMGRNAFNIFQKYYPSNPATYFLQQCELI